jgi:hypothetical protein
MTETTQASSREELADAIRQAQSDWWLALLVRFANETAFSFPITLSVSGMLVSGVLVGGKEYFEGIAETISKGVPDEEDRASLRDLFGAPATIYDESSDDNPPAEDDKPEPPPPGFIHLKDARLWSPDRSPLSRQRGIWWRGRIAAIDGFFFGEPTWPTEDDEIV